MDKERKEELQKWFEERAKETPIEKVVPPPPPKPPVLAIRSWIIPCKWCADKAGATGEPDKSCRWCKGKGRIIITG